MSNGLDDADDKRLDVHEFAKRSLAVDHNPADFVRRLMERLDVDPEDPLLGTLCLNYGLALWMMSMCRLGITAQILKEAQQENMPIYEKAAEIAQSTTRIHQIEKLESELWHAWERMRCALNRPRPTAYSAKKYSAEAE